MDDVGTMLTAGNQLFDDLMRFRPDGLTANGWAVKAGVSRTIWADLKRHGNPSRRTLEKLLSAAGSSLAEFEALRVSHRPGQVAVEASGTAFAEQVAQPWRPAPLKPLPQYAARQGQDWPDNGGEIVEVGFGCIVGQVERGASLSGDREAYAIAYPGEAMWPRFRRGRVLLVSPSAPVEIGDDILLWLAGGCEDGWRRIMVMELARRSAAFVELRQFNPDKTFRVNSGQIASLHKVLGEAI